MVLIFVQAPGESAEGGEGEESGEASDVKGASSDDQESEQVDEG